MTKLLNISSKLETISNSLVGYHNVGVKEHGWYPYDHIILYHIS